MISSYTKNQESITIPHKKQFNKQIQLTNQNNIQTLQLLTKNHQNKEKLKIIPNHNQHT